MRKDGVVWAVIPSKGPYGAKQRLSSVMSPALRGAFAMAMLADVLDALANVSPLTGIAVVTDSRESAEIARRFGAHVFAEPAAEGHTAAIALAAKRLRTEGVGAMLALPGGIPLVKSSEIGAILQAQNAAPSFVIVPAADERGSNAVLVAPPGAVPLKYGEDSFFSLSGESRSTWHNAVSFAFVRHAMDIDTPGDLSRFLKQPNRTRARSVLSEHGFFKRRTKANRLAAIPHRSTAG
jgi:2-phospho-L-lactate guanylyltransferase